jgi:hypothetical protein
MEKHMVYAEDILQELMNHPDNTIYKWELKQIIEKVVREKEVTIRMCMPIAGCGEEVD